MISLPPRLSQKKPRRDNRIRSSAHLKWVRGHACCVRNCQHQPIEAAHVRTGTDGGTGMKPGDNWTISLCFTHHTHQHNVGEDAFERQYEIDMKKLAAEFWRRSPLSFPYRGKNEEDSMTESILEEAAFRAWLTNWQNTDKDPQLTYAYRAQIWPNLSEERRSECREAARAVLEFAAEIVTGEQPVSLGSDDDAQRAICRRIAAKLTGGSHV